MYSNITFSLRWYSASWLPFLSNSSSNYPKKKRNFALNFERYWNLELGSYVSFLDHSKTGGFGSIWLTGKPLKTVSIARKIQISINWFSKTPWDVKGLRSTKKELLWKARKLKLKIAPKRLNSWPKIASWNINSLRNHKFKLNVPYIEL